MQRRVASHRGAMRSRDEIVARATSVCARARRSPLFSTDDVFRRAFRGMPRAGLIVTELGPRATLRQSTAPRRCARENEHGASMCIYARAIDRVGVVWLGQVDAWPAALTHHRPHTTVPPPFFLTVTPTILLPCPVCVLSDFFTSAIFEFRFLLG